MAAGFVVGTAAVAQFQLPGGIRLPTIKIPLSRINVEDWLVEQLAKSDELPEGDRRRRDRDGALPLTPEEQRGADQAAALFSRTASQARSARANVELYQPGTAIGRAQEKRLRDLIERLSAKPVRSAEEREQLRAATMPFYLYFLQRESAKAGDPVEIIAPRSVQTYDLATYCMDHSRSAPKTGEQFQLVPAASLMPPGLEPVYHGLLREGARTGGHDGAIQGLIWQLRDTAIGRGMTQRQLQLSPQQQAALERAQPGSVQALQNYYQRAEGARQRQVLARSGVRAVGRTLGIDLSSLGTARVLSPITNSDVYHRVQSTTAQLESMSPSGRTANNSGYTLLNSQVAARAESVSGGLSTVRISVANASDTPAVFKPQSCAAQSTRNVQRLAIQPLARATPHAASEPQAAFIHAAWSPDSSPLRMTPLIWYSNDPIRPTRIVLPAAPVVAAGAVAFGPEILAAIGGVVAGTTTAFLNANALVKTLLAEALVDCANGTPSATCSEANGKPALPPTVGPAPQASAGSPMPDPDDDNPNLGNLRRASIKDLQKAAKEDGFDRVEQWKTQRLGLSSREDIFMDRGGNLYSLPRRGGSNPQSLGIRISR